MEDIEDSDSSKDEVQLGRLHFSMDYDFTKSEVLHYLYYQLVNINYYKLLKQTISLRATNCVQCTVTIALIVKITVK